MRTGSRRNLWWGLLIGLGLCVLGLAGLYLAGYRLMRHAAAPLAVPTVDVLAKHGFSMKYEIQPREWEKGKIFKVACPEERCRRIQPDKHYPLIMEHVRKQAVEKYGYIID